MGAQDKSIYAQDKCFGPGEKFKMVYLSSCNTLKVPFWSGRSGRSGRSGTNDLPWAISHVT